MRLKSIKADGIGPLCNIEIDFAALGAGLIALVGPTGRGKSHLLGLCGPTAWYREDPYYGDSIFDHIDGKRGEVETHWDINGHDIGFRIVGQGRAKEAYLNVDGGTPIGGPSKLKEYDTEVAKWVPKREDALASIFAVQHGTGSFFRVDQSTRLSLFSRLINVDRYEKWAEIAAQKRLLYVRGYDAAKRAVEEAIARVGERDRLREQVGELRGVAIAAEANLADQTAKLKVAEARLQSVLDIYNETARRRAKEEATGHALQKQAAELAPIITGLRKKIQDLLEQDGGVEDPTALEAQFREACESVEALRVVAEAKKQAYYRVEMDLEAVEGGIAENEKIVRDAQASLKVFSAQLARRLAELDGLIGGMSSVDLGQEICRRCPLTEEGRKAQDARDAAIAVHREAQNKLHEESASATLEVQHLSAMASELRLSVDAANLAMDQSASLLQAAEGEQVSLSKQLQAILQSSNANSQRQTLMAQLAERVIAQGKLKDQIAAQAAVVSAIKDNSQDVAKAKMEASEYPVEAARQADAKARAALAHAEGQLSALADVDQRLERALTEVDIIESAMADFDDLKWGLGHLRDLCIDDACPEIGDLASDILSGFQDGRFRIALSPWVETKDGKREKREFNARIIDTKVDQVRKKVSGGETSVCDEAFRGATSIYNARNFGLVTETMFRDETAGSLDPESAIYYVGMLRRMWKAANLHQCIFVAHSEAVCAQADRRIYLLEDGVRVE